MCRWTVLGAVSLALAACTRSVPLARVAQDLRAASVRTLALADRYTLVSPLPPAESARFGAIVAEELRLVEGFFGLRLTRPVTVELRRRGAGTSGGPVISGTTVVVGKEFFPVVTIYLEPGLERRPEACRRTVRHELAHVCFRAVGLEGPHWLDEGLAVLVAGTRVTARGLSVPRSGPLLRLAARLARRVPLARVLAWEEDLTRVARGEEPVFAAGRPLAMSWVQFLLERYPERPLPRTLRRLAALGRKELLALEPAWRRWLVARAAPRMDGRQQAR